MAAPVKIQKATNFIILVSLTLLFFTFLNFFSINQEPDWGRSSILICSNLKRSRTNLIQNYSSRKSKLINGSRIFTASKHQISKTTLLTLILILSNDIELNPGPRNASIFPCGYCDQPVNWLTKEFAVTNLASGTTNHVATSVRKKWNIWNVQMLFGFAANVRV